MTLLYLVVVYRAMPQVLWAESTDNGTRQQQDTLNGSKEATVLGPGSGDQVASLQGPTWLV